jgi:RNA polymerase sigma-70 factor (ECF subfamily)
LTRLIAISNDGAPHGVEMEPMAAIPGADDGELVARMRSGDEAAFTEIYRRHNPMIYRLAIQMSGSRTLAEEVVQDVFLALIRRGEAYDPGRAALSTYLYGIARNCIFRWLDRNSRYVPLPDEADGEALKTLPVARAGDAASELDERERSALLHQAILALPPHYREAVALCDLEEMSYAAAATAAGCSIGTMRSRLNRGRTLLAEKLRRKEAVPAAAQSDAARCLP